MPGLLDQAQGISLNDIVFSERGNYESRETVSVLAGQTVSKGSVIGKVTAGSVPTTGTAGVGNTGDGTCTAVTGGVDVKVGTYTLTCIQAVLNGGVFTVQDPDGYALPNIVVGTAYTNNQINLIINDGGADFGVNDTFTIVVAAGGLQVRPINFSGVDGTEHAYGIMTDAVDASAPSEYSRAFTSGGTYEITPGDTILGATSSATARVIKVEVSSGTWAGGDAAGTITIDTKSGTFQAENLNIGDNSNVATIAGAFTQTSAADTDGVAIVRDAEITATNLVWPSGTTTAQKAAALAQLKALGIIERIQG